MCNQCEYCLHSKFHKGAVRGVMDCDPDEYWCDVDEDMYYFSDDDSIISYMKEEFISEQIKAGVSEDEIDELLETTDFEVDCPSFVYASYEEW